MTKQPDQPSKNQQTPKEGGEQSFHRLVDEYGGTLHSLGIRFCGSPTEAEDLVQEVFLQAYKGWSKFEGRSSPKTWLYSIAARTCQRLHRKRSGQPDSIESLDELLPMGEPRIARIPDELESVVQHQIRREARERIEAAIPLLPDEFRIALVLKDIVGFTVPEIAQMLDEEEGTIRSRVHRARLKLRALVDGLIPRTETQASPLAYSQQTCLDLLDAKQRALDQGVEFDQSIICERCRSVFSTLDLTQDLCKELAENDLPEDLRNRLHAMASGLKDR